MAKRITPKRANDPVRPPSDENSNDIKSWLNTLLAAAPLLGKNRTFLLVLLLVGLSYATVSSQPWVIAFVVVIAILGTVFLIYKGMLPE